MSQKVPFMKKTFLSTLNFFIGDYVLIKVKKLNFQGFLKKSINL